MHITVTIPVFNRESLIKRTIESVLNQSFKDYDLLIVDDASTDLTTTVIEEIRHSHPEIQLIKNKKNLGLTRNWNRCLTLARGPLVQVLLSDDLIDPNYLEVVSNIFSQYENVGIVAASCRYIDINDKVIHPGIPKKPHLYKAGDEAVSAFLINGFPHVSSIIFKKDCYEKLGLFNEKIWHGPDVEMDTRIATRYDYFHLGDVYTSFRRHGSNMGNLEYMRDDFLVVDKLKKTISWGYLTPEKLAQLGIKNFNNYINHEMALTAITGVSVMVAIGKFNRARYYFWRSLIFDKKIVFSSKFWKSFILLLIPFWGQKIMSLRMGMRKEDEKLVTLVEQSLDQIP